MGEMGTEGAKVGMNGDLVCLGGEMDFGHGVMVSSHSCCVEAGLCVDREPGEGFELVAEGVWLRVSFFGFGLSP